MRRLVLLPFMISAHALVLQTSSVAAEPERAYSCERGVNYYLSALHVDPPEGDNAKVRVTLEQDEITAQAVEEAVFLKNGFARKLYKLKPEHQKVCLDLAKAALTEIPVLFKARLQLLLDQAKLDEFYTEIHALVSVDSTMLFIGNADLESLKRTYLDVLYRILLKRLEHSPWDAYRKIPIHLTSWNAEWFVLTGREAPAAVEFGSDRIALRPLDYRPSELLIFMFHEIAHLADPGLHPGTVGLSRDQALANEVYAWRQTLSFMDYEKSRNEALPSLADEIQTGVKTMGLEQWVRMVFESAHRN